MSPSPNRFIICGDFVTGTKRKLGVAAFAFVLSVVGLVAQPGADEATAATTTYTAPLRTAVASLKVASENRSGYDRSKFKHWIDADGDSCDTREEVLVAEAIVKPHRGSGCSLSGGRWYSYYDNKYWNDKSSIDIDHVVALAEAWDSGARSWTSARRQSYANDLTDSRTLVGVTDSVNQSKSDKDPAEWLPSYDRCRYIRHWVMVKIRWWLTVNTAEKNKLISIANSCPNITMTVLRTTNPGTTTPTTNPPTTKPSNPGDSKNCSDFATYAQAKAWFDKYYPYYGDVAGLDSDGDRKPCETLPGAP